jgi:hypothetical protein
MPGGMRTGGRWISTAVLERHRERGNVTTNALERQSTERRTEIERSGLDARDKSFDLQGGDDS